MNLHSILKNKNVNIPCSNCGYTFRLNYTELKPEKSLVFCPCCYTEKTVLSKQDVIKMFTEKMNNLHSLNTIAEEMNNLRSLSEVTEEMNNLSSLSKITEEN